MRPLFVFFVLSTLLGSCSKKEALKPLDFEAFWKESLTELNTIPMEKYQNRQRHYDKKQDYKPL